MTQDPPVPESPGAGDDSARPEAFLAARLAEQVGRLEEALDRLLGDAVDDEAVHDVRVATRRLRGTFDAGDPWLGGRRRRRRIGRRLKRLRRELGGAREAEVGVERLRELCGELPAAERPAAAALAGLLAARRDEARGGMAGRLADLDLKRLRRALGKLRGRAIVERPAEADATPGPSPEEFRRQVLERLHDFWRPLREAAPGPLFDLDDAAQHRFRIDGKKLRYALELFAPLFPPRLLARVALLKETQDQLGHLHDLADLAAEARRMAGAVTAGGFDDAAAGYRLLAERIDGERRRAFDGFDKRHAALVHAGFLPPLPAPAMPDRESAPATPDGESAAAMPLPAPATADRDSAAGSDPLSGAGAAGADPAAEPASPLRLVVGRDAGEPE